jgi:hypothetical protein
MLTFEDCLGLAELTEEEIVAIAEHEHIPEIAALELGEYLLTLPDGTLAIKRMILDDIEEAKRSGNTDRKLRLKATLKHFVDTHPDNPRRRKQAAP